jgi:ElaB/YqjD/DUF883 family membrane-anchored ribosome-binding protein
MRRGGQAIDEMAQQSGRSSSNLYDSGRDAAEEAARSASDAARGFTRSASDAYERATDMAGDTYRDARRFAGDAYQGAAGMVQDTAYAVQRRASSFDEALGEQLSRNPVTALVVAVGVGFVLGAWYASNGRAFGR